MDKEKKYYAELLRKRELLKGRINVPILERVREDKKIKLDIEE